MHVDSHFVGDKLFAFNFQFTLLYRHLKFLFFNVLTMQQCVQIFKYVHVQICVEIICIPINAFNVERFEAETKLKLFVEKFLQNIKRQKLNLHLC